MTDTLGNGMDVVRLTVGADQAVDNTIGDGIVVGAILTPAAAVATAQIKRNNGGAVICDLQAAASGASAIFAPNWGLVYGGAAPCLSATVAGTGAVLDVYFKKRH